MRRLLLLTAFHSCTPWFVNKRTAKPFISLLGETFELVTDKYRYYGETVQVGPPVLAFHAEG